MIEIFLKNENNSWKINKNEKKSGKFLKMKKINISIFFFPITEKLKNAGIFFFFGKMKKIHFFFGSKKFYFIKNIKFRNLKYFENNKKIYFDFF